jgi:sulfite exporter TauE/SafE
MTLPLPAPLSTALAAALPMLLVGLAGSVHCVGMCGGIVSAFSLAPGRPVPVALVAARPAARAASLAPALPRVLAYNAGRLASYTAAGAIAGGVSGGVRLLAGFAAVEAVALWLVGAMLVVLGLYLMDAWRGLAVLERLGGHLWRRLEPLTAALLPLDSPAKLFAVGAVWGWLPCGMVYSALLVALVSGSALAGALVMLAFGLGTLPLLLTIGVAGARWRAALKRRAVRVVGGAVVLGFGVAGLVRAAAGAAPDWLLALCHTPAALALP